MSRVAKKPVVIPEGVEVTVGGSAVTVKGPGGTMVEKFADGVVINCQGKVLTFSAGKEAEGVNALLGTSRAVVNNMVLGVTQRFTRKLILVGVGFKAQVQSRVLVLALGFSHPVNYAIPEGITIETPSQTEVVIKGISKELVGQVAAEIRAYRPPEPYKGKGVRYEGEVIILKEGKKK